MARLGEFGEKISRRLRMKRSWRYVSSRRRGVGLVLLIAVVSLTYAYWHFTNDRRVARMAQRYLTQALGGTVRIDHARFHLFGPVEVRGVRLWLPDGDGSAHHPAGEPFFHARLIEVRHNPWSLLAGRFEPTDIYCDSATLTAHRDESTGEIDLQRLLPLLQQNSASGDESVPLPAVNVRNCTLIMFKEQAQLRQRLQWRVGLTMGVHAPGVYRVMWEAMDDIGRSQHQGVDIELAGGRLTPMGTIGIEQSAALLPPKYLDWVRRYDIKGEIRLGPVSRDAGVPPERPAGILPARDSEGGLASSSGRTNGTHNAGETPATRETPATQTAPVNEVFQCELVDVSLQFPPEEGGLAVHHLFGTLRMSRDGIEFQNVRGRVRQAGDAEFTLRGRYDGFHADSAFEVELAVKDLALPEVGEVGGPLADALAWASEDVAPRGGRFTVIASARRDGDGTLDYEAVVNVKGMAMELVWFPLAVTDVTGEVVIDKAGVHLRDLTARQGAAVLKIAGDVHELVFNAPLRVTVETSDARANDALAKAANHVAPGVWDALSPEGQAAVKVNVVRLVRDEHLSVEVDVKLDGRVSMCYSGFRYPLEELTGVVHIHDDDVTVNRVTGHHGAARFRFDGKLMNLSDPDAQQIDLAVEAFDLPLDDTLSAAIDSVRVAGILPASSTGVSPVSRMGVSPMQRGLGSDAAESARAATSSREETPATLATGETPVGLMGETPMLRAGETPAAREGGAARAMFTDLGLAGVVEKLTGRVTKPADGAMSYELHADLANARVLPTAFPYELTDLQARLRITPEQVEFERFTARHGQARVEGSGTALTRRSPTGIALNVTAKSVELGEDLLAVLPSESADLVRKFAPKGSADLDLRYSLHMPRTDDGYTVTIRPRDIDVTFDEFPYTFRGVTGEIVATPDEITLRPLRAKMDDATAELRGTVRFRDRRVEVDFTSVHAGNVPLDETLLQAVPGDVSWVTQHLAPGGTCSVELTKLQMLREPPPPAAPTEAITILTPTSAAATPADHRVTWSCEGTTMFRQAVVKLGDEPKTVTGTLSGQVSSSAEGLAVTAEVAVDGVEIGPRQLTELHGRIVKSPQRDVVRLEQLAAKLYDGMVAGEAELRLDPFGYALRVEFDNVDLDALVNAGAKEEDKAKLVGRLGGSATYALRPQSARDKPAEREATGNFQITKAKIGKLPVMLDLLNIFYLSLPGDGAFTHGNMTYHLKGDTLVLSEIRFTGPGLSIAGAGTLAMKSERLNLTFLTAPPNRLPEIGLLQDVLASITRELNEVRVTGTLSKPKISTRALQSLDDVLRILLNPEASDK